MIKRFIVFTFVTVFAVGTHSFSVSAVNISAQCAVVMNCDTGEIVYSKNPDTKRPMASTTKIMTSLLAVESGKLNEVVEIKNDIVIDGTGVGVKKGYKYKLTDLVYAMMLESGNDAAYAVACYLGQSEEKFALQMNKKASEIGMNNTNFVTSSGLDAELHYSTAYDMALLGRYAIRNETFRKICSTKQKSVTLVSPDITFSYSNHNRLLKTLDGIIGIKTGFTKKSGRCLVTACQRNSTTYVAVTLNAPDDWNDHKKLYAYAFENTKIIDITPQLPAEIKVYGGTVGKITFSCENISVPYVRSPEYEAEVILPKFIYAPINIGDTVGKVILNFPDGSQFETDITADSTVNKIKGKDKVPNIFSRVIRKILHK